MDLRELTRVVSTIRKSRGLEEIEFDSHELRQFVENWLNSEGWELSDLTRLLEMANIYKPAKLTDLCDCTFKCVTKSGQEYEITLKKADSNTGIASFCITEAERHQERRYTINRNDSKEKSNLCVHLECKVLRDKDNIFRELKSYYYEDHTYRIFQDMTFAKVIVEIVEDSSKKWPLSDYKIENYLVSLKKEATGLRILEGLFTLVPTLKETATKIEITVNKVVDGEEKVIDWIKMESGKIWTIGVF